MKTATDMKSLDDKALNFILSSTVLCLTLAVVFLFFISTRQAFHVITAVLYLLKGVNSLLPVNSHSIERCCQE